MRYYQCQKCGWALEEEQPDPKFYDKISGHEAKCKVEKIEEGETIPIPKMPSVKTRKRKKRKAYRR